MNALSLGLPLIFLSLGMAAAWAVQRRTGNSGWVDMAWSALTGLAAILGLGLAGVLTTGPGMLAAAILALWAGRLAIHIGGRSRFAGEDPRYAALIEEWGDQAPRQLFKFLQIQAVVSFVLVVSVMAAATGGSVELNQFHLVAFAIALMAVLGEALADRQLQEFRRENKGFKGICETGLWRWSRHPNYFFEWLYWCAWPVMAMAAGPVSVALALLAPALMYYLLVHVSGIPPLEKYMLASRGERFRLYQNRVNAFFPGPPRPIQLKETAK
jgi:steroid 5-alpha reductase family enzyme